MFVANQNIRDPDDSGESEEDVSEGDILQVMRIAEIKRRIYLSLISFISIHLKLLNINFWFKFCTSFFCS